VRTSFIRQILEVAATAARPLKETPMHHSSRRRRRCRTDRGITTAEYAVGTAAGAGLAGLLFKMLTGGFGNELLQRLYDHVMQLLGI
jgi:hypothetical protein